MRSPLKGFLLIVPLKQPETNKDFDLTPRCAVWLRCVMHTAELDSAVGCTPQSLTPWWQAHRGARLCGGMHTAELFEKFWSLDSEVWCTPRSLTPRWDAHRGVRRCLLFVFLYFLHWKTSEVKKIPWAVCDLCYYFHVNIFRHHREITFVNFRIKIDT